MKLFVPGSPEPKLVPQPVVIRRGERGSRGPRKVAKNQQLEKFRGFLLGDGDGSRTSRWWYDLDGRFCRKANNRRVVVELWGPRRMFASLTEDERQAVLRARRRAIDGNRLFSKQGREKRIPRWAMPEEGDD